MTRKDIVSLHHIYVCLPSYIYFTHIQNVFTHTSLLIYALTPLSIYLVIIIIVFHPPLSLIIRAVRQGFLLCTDRALEVVVETRRALLALVRHADTPNSLTTGPSPSSDASVAPHSHSYVFDFEACGAALTTCDASLALLVALVAQQSTSLRSVVHEPVILSPPFPVAEHAALLDQFRQVNNNNHNHNHNNIKNHTDHL